MRRIVLFSTPYNNKNFHDILNAIFPSNMKDKQPLFMPSQGLSNTPQHYLNDWEVFIKKFKVDLDYIDNTAIDIINEREKLRESNILIISGGDPFQLLINLRNSGLDSAIIQFAKKDHFVIAGYSAGAYILSPTLAIAKIFNDKIRKVRLETQDKIKDFTGLGIIDFEVWAHYSEIKHKDFIENYSKRTNNEIKLLGDNDFVVIDF